MQLLRHPMHQIARLPAQGPQRPLHGEAHRCQLSPKGCWVLMVVSHRPLGREIDKAPVVAADNLLPGWTQGVPLPQHSVGGWLEFGFVFFDARGAVLQEEPHDGIASSLARGD